jgi:hypothetical protein
MYNINSLGKISLSFLFVTVFCLFFARAAFAGDSYTISDIRISAEGKTATQARAIGLVEGQLKAFSLLLNNLWPDTSPTIVESKVRSLGSEKILGLVADYSVTSEKIGATSYKAILAVSFNYELVQGTLGNRVLTDTSQKEARKMRLVLNFADYSEWLALKKKLKTISGISHFTLISLTTNRAVVEIESRVSKQEIAGKLNIK